MQEMEEARKKNEPLNEIQQEEKVKNELLLNKAQQALLEQTDEVKDINRMIMYSKCVTIRDKQLDEKKRIKVIILQRVVYLNGFRMITKLRRNAKI
jgi:hypothetical protein